ncbi:myosin-IIIb-like isoform X3 [Artemia franciscana]|uniref:non-specific serine/threonine protein kinase n=4 Tax=Artemia franciscana TaxID=6661 RepID=A0AA88L9B3_ARTSF|nr:hypothetical protein QYM36_001749 [Artemia franciscana]
MSYLGLSQHIHFDDLPDPSGRFQLDGVIGEGTYGEVFKAFDLETGQKIAVKIMENIADNIEEIEEEYLVLRDLCLHPNIPSFIGLFLKKGGRRDEDQLWFCMELCSGGSVTDLVQALTSVGQCLTEEQIAYIIKETLEALVYLHQNHCMHRDVKGHNILLTENAEIKLIDFGVSSHLASTLGRKNTSVGTPYWMAPEVIACEQQLDYAYDVRCDIWSLGITAIELAEGDPPLAELHPMRALFQIPRNPPPQLKRPMEWSEEFNDFIEVCLKKDFEKRPFARALMEHPFTRQVPPNPDMIRGPLKQLVEAMRSGGASRREPEPTIRQGNLKQDRKAKLQPMYVDDLASLENLTNDIIVDHLQRRFSQGQIYTYIGDILIAVNPYAEMGIYTDAEAKLYRSRGKMDHPPHIFAVADTAYHTMLHLKMNQSIIVSGESGSGKTESANFLLRQLVYLGKAPNRTIEEKILQMNPLMEAFGNAATGINDNSSRFGKFLDITFTETGMISGAKVTVYLLEQSRIVRQAIGERNYHIFYYLYDGLQGKNKLKGYCLDSSRKTCHRYLSSPLGMVQSIEENQQKFNQIEHSFELLGFRSHEIGSIYQILAGIINLGDIQFKEYQSPNNTEAAEIVDQQKMINVANLLSVEVKDLIESLTSTSVVAKGETITRKNTVSEATCARDAMAKGLYSRLFDWIVHQINKHLALGRIIYGEPLAVGLLDIFGFENFETNSFEQLCINIANEQVQYFFNQHIFTWEQQEYMSEGIDVQMVQFSDNRPVLDMFLCKPLGILALIDEESRFPKATDFSLVDKFNQNVTNPCYVRSKAADLTFSIRHYAACVVYDANNFLPKNRNFLAQEVIQVLRQSSDEVVQFLFQCPLTKTGNLFAATPRNSPGGTLKKNSPKVKLMSATGSVQETRIYNTQGLASQTRAQQTVATYFRYSLMDLLQKMVGGMPHFVRCIKPNDKNVPKLFEKMKVLKQLEYAGVMETVKMRQNGFSSRPTFADFLKRYCFLAFDYHERVVANRESVVTLLERMKLDGWAVGKTKVFLKYYHVEYLSRLHDEHVRRIIRIQACVRRWLAKIRMDKQKSEPGVLSITTPIAEFPRDFPTGLSRDEAAVIIQKYYRGYAVRDKYGPELNRRLSIKKKRESINAESENKENSEKSMADVVKKGEDLKEFVQQVHERNREIHINLRNIRGSVREEDKTTPPSWYKRPNGFETVPQMIAHYEKQRRVKSKPVITISTYEEAYGKEPRSYDLEDLDSDEWDAPMKQPTLKLQSRRKTQDKKISVDLEMREILLQGLKSQNRANKEREDKLISQWKGVVQAAESNAVVLEEIVARSSKKSPFNSQENSKHVNRSSVKLLQPQPINKIPLNADGFMKPVLRPIKQNFQPASDLQGLLRNQPPEFSGNSSMPYDFRARLRPTANPPTESLRKRRGFCGMEPREQEVNISSEGTTMSPSVKDEKQINGETNKTKIPNK